MQKTKKGTSSGVSVILIVLIVAVSAAAKRSEVNGYVTKLKPASQITSGSDDQADGE